MSNNGWNFAHIRYALVSVQGKGQPKYVRMRGQTVEEVLTKTEYTSAVRPLHTENFDRSDI